MKARLPQRSAPQKASLSRQRLHIAGTSVVTNHHSLEWQQLLE